MKRLDYKTCIYNADTLEHIGNYDENQVGIMRKHEIVVDFHSCLYTWIIMFLFISIICMKCRMLANSYEESQHENLELKAEIEQLKAEAEQLNLCITAAEHELNVETLAGKYATLRTPVPTDMNEVYKMCIQSGAWYPEIIMAQFILESGSGTSKVASSARNFYGMKYIGTKGRPTLQIPNTNFSGYGVYLNWQHSVLDRVMWDDHVFNKTMPTKDQYLDKISNIYAEDPHYIDKLLPIANEWAAKTDSLCLAMMDYGDTLIQ